MDRLRSILPICHKFGKGQGIATKLHDHIVHASHRRGIPRDVLEVILASLWVHHRGRHPRDDVTVPFRVERRRRLLEVGDRVVVRGVAVHETMLYGTRGRRVEHLLHLVLGIRGVYPRDFDRDPGDVMEVGGSRGSRRRPWWRICIGPCRAFLRKLRLLRRRVRCFYYLRRRELGFGVARWRGLGLGRRDMKWISFFFGVVSDFVMVLF